MTTNRTPWTPGENRALVAMYFTMLDAATIGAAYSKAGMIRQAQGTQPATDFGRQFAGELAHRSRGSIEAKLMNATAAHRDLYPGDVTMDGYGYRALANYQASLKEAMQDELNRRHDLERAAQ
jgi:hypothetical protein